VDKKRCKSAYLNRDLPCSARVQDLLQQMTLEEKLAQMTSFWFSELQESRKISDGKMQSLLGNGIGEISRIGGSSLLPPAEAARAGNQIQRFLMEQTRLGIPAILHEECCAGYIGMGGTVFPQIIGLASTWNPAWVERMAQEIRKQFLAIGARQGLGPVLDIAIDPRWGRLEETFGEDPFLVTQFGMSYIRGLQGGDTDGLLATGKHFIGHSMALGGLNCAPTHLGNRTLWDVYLMPFQAAVREAGLRSAMDCYNELDGEPVAASRTVMNDLLRGRLGFSGLVVSDYHAIDMIQTFHRAAEDQKTAAVRALRAGIDLELPTRICYADPLRQALEAGEISMEEVDTAVGRILSAKFQLGLFEEPYVDEAAAMEVFDTADQRALTRDIARQSIVLLKNNGILPLKNPGTLAVIGPNADAPRHLVGAYSYPAMLDLMTFAPGPGWGQMDAAEAARALQTKGVSIPSVLEGIRQQAGGQTKVLYAPGCPVLETDRSGFDEAVRTASQADVVVLVVGDKSGMIPSCTCGETRDRVELTLPGVQEELAKAVAGTGKPVVVVLVNGRPVSSPWLQENAAAIVEAWLPGEEGATAIADVLFGKMNPGGKLPVTVVRSVGQVPAPYYHKPSGGRSNWHGDYVDSPAKPLYPFGFGLSYTTFEYSDLVVTPATAASGGNVEIRFNIANAGSVAGDEVVQLYACDEYASIPRPMKELKGFARLALPPGGRRTVTFHFPVDLMAFYDEDLALVVEPGTIKIMIGSSSEDIRLQGSFTISGDHKILVSQRTFDCLAETA
jgi:beta-glucosidase